MGLKDNNGQMEVEGTLFRVPRHPFEQESEVFRDMFRLPIPKDSVPDGCNDSRPLRLDGILKKDFRPLLRVMFPTYAFIIATYGLTPH